MECRPARGIFWPAIEGAYQRGEIELDEFASRFAELIGGIYTAEEVVRVHHAWTLGEYPGVAALVDDLHGAGLVTAVLSNTSHDHWITFSRRYPVFDRFGHRHGSHLIGACKPAPAAFRAIEASTGQAGRAIIFFDDLIDNVRGARDFGWEAECVDPHGSPPEQIRVVLVGRGALS